MSTLCTVLNSSSDQGVLVSLHLGSHPEAVGEASLMTSYAAVDLDSTAHSEHDRARHSTHTARYDIA